LSILIVCTSKVVVKFIIESFVIINLLGIVFKIWHRLSTFCEVF